MAKKLTYEELKQRVLELEKETAKREIAERALERKRVQEELSVVYDALNSSVSGVIITNLEGKITYVNPAFLRIFEYDDKREVLNKNAAILFATTEVKKFSDVQAIIDETRGETEEFRVVRKDGTTFPVEVSSSIVTDEKGGAVGRMASFVDITDRKQAERALRESENRYRRITEAITTYVYTVRIRNGRPVETIHEPACVAVTGYTEEDFKAYPYLWIQMVYEEDRRAVEEQVAKILSGVVVEPLEHRIVRRDGEIRWIRNTFVPYYDSQGHLSSYDGVINDIHERKVVEEALMESEKKYSALVENSLTGIYIDHDGKIVFANDEFGRIYKYSRDELIGIEPWKLVHPEDRAWTDEVRAKRLKGEDAPLEYEARGLTKDGKAIWIKRRNRRIEYQGKPAILGNIADITEQKRADEELRKINQELKNFVQVVSHDLKTPIISIQGFSSRLLKVFEEALGEKGRGYVTQINASARRMEMFVSDLLSLATVGRAVSDFDDVSSLEIVENVLAGLQGRFSEGGIEVVLGDSLPVIRCDAHRIYQVFENLLVNAVNAVGDTSNPKIEVGYKDRGELHQFFVRDNGVGIDPRDHRRIFDMFYRTLESAKVKGTGLGLAIVEKAIRSHGGEVWVEPERGKGATFYFALPKDPTPR